MFKIHTKIIIFILILVTPKFYLIPLAKAEDNLSNLDNYVKYFYNRYNNHFDQNGLIYATPEYGVQEFTPAQKIREWISLISYYKYKAISGDKKAQNIIRFGILNGYDELLKRGSKSQSFQEAEAHFLTIQILEKIPNLLKSKTKEAIYNIINLYLEDGIKAPDTENRALIAGTYWQYINNYLFEKNIINSEKKEYLNQLIKTKINSAIKKSINPDYWYLENNFQNFSVHYHAISAFMLMNYGELTGQTEYLNIAHQMYNNLQKITMSNGKIPAKFGIRPSSLGAQFYLMTGLLSYYFNDLNYMNYFSVIEGDNFFQDPNYPNRLEYHNNNIFNDDYAFSDIAELGLTMPKLNNISFYYKITLPRPGQEFRDNTFYIQNTGEEIIITKL